MSVSRDRVSISLQTTRRHRRVLLKLTHIPVFQNQVISLIAHISRHQLHVFHGRKRAPHLNILVHHVHHISADVAHTE